MLWKGQNFGKDDNQPTLHGAPFAVKMYGAGGMLKRE
jgi:hypothetical protein